MVVVPLVVVVAAVEVVCTKKRERVAAERWSQSSASAVDCCPCNNWPGCSWRNCRPGIRTRDGLQLN